MNSTLGSVVPLAMFLKLHDLFHWLKSTSHFYRGQGRLHPLFSSNALMYDAVQVKIDDLSCMLLTRGHNMEQKLYWLSQVVGRALTDLDSLHVRESPININPILNLTSTFRCWHWLTLPSLHQELDLEPLSCDGGEPWRDGSLLLTFLREVWCLILMLVVTMAMMVASFSSSIRIVTSSRVA